MDHAPMMAEYIWIDGQEPTKKLRSKTKVIEGQFHQLEDLPEWSFDGSSTKQAEGHFSDLILKPVEFFTDPIRPPIASSHKELRERHNLLVLCEVMNQDGAPHVSNTRAALAELMKAHAEQEPWVGIEQEYTLYDKDGGRPHRWPPQSTAFPAPQGPYYCGVGSDEVYGRKLVETHLRACLSVGIGICGVNAEVMPSQWEFQVGTLDPLECSDQLWLARWILYRLGEEFGISVKLDPKPIGGDWNGAGAHCNFSTKAMREPRGLKHIEAACKKLAMAHASHVEVYGADNDKRLTGAHETCDINTFRYGVGNRSASVRIPTAVSNAGCGYLEDRRPAANADPYEVCHAMLQTICG